jgi:hypothetical protein
MHTPFQRFAARNMGLRPGSAPVARVWHLHRTRLAGNEMRGGTEPERRQGRPAKVGAG